MRDPEITLYVGVQGTGKTTQALADASALSWWTGCPLLVVDSVGADNFRSWAHAPDLRTLAADVYDAGGPGVFMPKTKHEFTQLVSGVYAAGNCVLLVDELRPWASTVWMPEVLDALLRAYRHKNVSILVTTQSIRDLHRSVRFSATAAHVYFTDQADDLDVIRERWGIPPERVRGLARGEAVSWRRPKFEKTPLTI